jgi:hypothetical protein
MNKVKYGRKKYTRRENKIIRTLHGFGYTSEKISQELINMSKFNEDIHPRTTRAIQIRLAHMGLKTHRLHNENWKPEHTKKLYELLESGADIDQCCHELGFSDTTIRAHAKMLNKILQKRTNNPRLYYTTNAGATEFEEKLKTQFTDNPYIPEPTEKNIFSIFKNILNKIRRRI